MYMRLIIMTILPAVSITLDLAVSERGWADVRGTGLNILGARIRLCGPFLESPGNFSGP